jgi:RNA polymerase sigma-70 factor (sigma-E family)
MVNESPDFQEFFVDQYERLRRLGFWLTGSWEQAEELAQDALVTTYRRWPVVRRLERPGDFARKVLVNRHRSPLRRMLVEHRHVHARRGEPVTTPAATEDAIVLAAALGRIPARQRLVVVLRYQEDLSEAEVARLLRIPLGTVKTLAHRGLKRLRRELQPSASDPPSAGGSPMTTLEERLRHAYELTAAPGTAGAYERFLRRRAARARRAAVVTSAVMALVLVAAGVAGSRLRGHDGGVVSAGPTAKAPLVVAAGDLGGKRWEYIAYQDSDGAACWGFRGPAITMAGTPRRSTTLTVTGVDLQGGRNLPDGSSGLCTPRGLMPPGRWMPRLGGMVLRVGDRVLLGVMVQPRVTRVEALLRRGRSIRSIELHPAGPEAGLRFGYAVLPASLDGGQVDALFAFDRRSKQLMEWHPRIDWGGSPVPQLPAWARTRDAGWLRPALGQAGYDLSLNSDGRPLIADGFAVASTVSYTILDRSLRTGPMFVADGVPAAWTTAVPDTPDKRLRAAGFHPASVTAGVQVYSDGVRWVWPAHGELVWFEPPPVDRGRLALLVAASLRAPGP